MIPKRQTKHEENVDSWLMSYADLITLLLCFFIIFVSVSEPKKDKISEIAEGMSGKFGSVQYSTPFAAAMQSAQSAIEKYRLYRDIAVVGGSRSLSIELATLRFFKNGGADFDDAMQPIMLDLVESLKKIELQNYTITIESHTDDSQPHSGLYNNNWDLSSIRAAKMAAYFIKNGIAPNKIKAVSYADSQPKVPNLDDKGEPIPQNRLINQRITIRIE